MEESLLVSLASIFKYNVAKTAKFYYINRQKIDVLLEEFKKPYAKYTSVQRWKNKLKNENYENNCLETLARFCVKFNTNSDELKSSNLLTRAKAEEKLKKVHTRMKQSLNVAFLS